MTAPAPAPEPAATQAPPEADRSPDPEPETGAETGQHSTSSVRRVIGGALALLSTQPITWAASLLVVAYVPRYLDASTMGEWAILNALSGLVGTLLALGVPTILVRRVAENPDDAKRLFLQGAVVLGVVGAAGALVLNLLVRGAGLTSLATLPPWSLELTMLGMVVLQLQAALFAILTGQHRFRRFAWLNAGTAVAISVLTVAVLMLGWGLIGLLAVNLLMGLVLLIVGCWSSRIGVDRAGLTLGVLWDLVWRGLPIMGMALVLRIRGDAEVFVLALGLSIEALGWWAAADRIVFIPLFIPTLVITPLLPTLSSVVTDRAVFVQTLRRSLDLTLVLTVGACAAILAVAPAVPETLGWSDDYLATVGLIEILSGVTALIAIGMVLGTAVIALGTERRWFLVSVLASVLYVGLTPLTIYVMTSWGLNGTYGVAYLKIVIEVVMIAGALILLPRGTVDRASWLVALKTVLASVAMILAVRAALPISLPLAIVTGALTYPAALLAVRTVPPSELREMIGFARDTLRRKRS